MFARMSVYHVHFWYPQVQKRASDPLDLEVQIVVNHYVGARNRAQDFCEGYS